MKALEDKILSEGVVLNSNILKVGSFLNQQLDVDFLMEMGSEIADIYSDSAVSKIVTIESSGIAVAVAAGAVMHLPVVFAKKHKSANLSGELLSTVVHSFTHNEDYTVVIPKEYVSENDRIIIIDDFLANGKALEGLIDIVKQSGAEFIGATCAIEKGFQHGGDKLREKGYRIESLAIIDSMSPGEIKFRRN